MLPLRIKATNLGAIPNIDIDLRGVNCASIVGPNGIGKTTTFTLIPTYCLYGVTKRGRTDNGISIDNMLKTGEHNLQALFEFEHSDKYYQIIRTYTDRGKGKSTLDFQVEINDKWESLNGTTIKETQAKIIELIGIDVDAFVSSSMVLQGKSNEFANKSAGDRKSVYTQILGLKIYDQLQAAAKKKADALVLQLETSKNKLADLKEKLQSLPEAEQQMNDISASITLNALSIREKETALSDAQAVIKDLENKEQQARETKKQMDDIGVDIQQKESEIADLDIKIQDAKQVLMDESEILAKVAELEEVKAKIPALQAKEDRTTQLKADGNKLVSEGKQLLIDRNNLRQKIEALELDLSYRDELKQASENYQQGLNDLKVMDEDAEQWQIIQNDILQVEKEIEQSGSRLNKLMTEKKNHETKSRLLEAANCPVQGEVNCNFLKDATESKKQIPIVDEEIAKVIEERTTQMDVIESLAEKQEELQYDKARHANCKKYVESLRLQAEAYTQLSGKEELLKTYQERRDSIVNQVNLLQDSISKIKQEVDQLQKETENLPILKASIPSLEKYVAMKDKLPEARTTIQLSEEAIVKLQTDIDQKNEQYQQLLQDYTSLSAEFAGLLPGARQKVETIEGELKALRDLSNVYFAKQGQYETKLDALTKDAEEKNKLSAELAPKAKELTRWQTLITAYGKSGIQALIIDSNLPEQQRLSNEILSIMTNGENSVRFDTQREKKTGSGQIETLDIWVADASGRERIYETYSGGQELRIDLALSLGLAALSASKSGSKIEFTVLDEVFGSQDSKHRQLVVDAIKAVSNRFKMVLVISHIEEVQAAFDQQIVLSEGGKVEVLFN